MFESHVTISRFHSPHPAILLISCRAQHAVLGRRGDDLAFYRYGIITARHWLLSILLSVATAVLLCYPVLFLYDNPTAGSYQLPHHVWTSARVLEGSEETRADVAMRQVWVHGDYMDALNHRVLEDALTIQDYLIGGSFGQHDIEVPELTPNGGAEHIVPNLSAIQADIDLLKTINEQTHRQSFLNLTLRPPSVFAGKSFEKNKLLAADALVITLFDRSGLDVGDDWDARSAALARNTSARWSFYPESGKAARSQLYEFRFRPVSWIDDFIMALAYGIMAFYVVVSLRKLRAVKSWVGLGLTVISQIAISVIASFSICGMLRINLARIPREAYPFVVFAIGLENMFRLINAVLANPPEMPTISRVGNALGDVGHLSLAAVAQNLVLLWLLSRVVSPGVAAFCAFAAVALVFDFLFHLTFFVPVLSVDVRRTELQDFLDKAGLSQARAKTPKQERQTWIHALFQGKLPVSTRIAGSAVMMCFVIALNWHFFDSENSALSVLQLFRLMRAAKKLRAHRDPLAIPPPINQARTLAAWLRMQDYDTAKEFVHFVKPYGHSFVVRLYEPLTVVMKGANRRGAMDESSSFLVALRNIAEEHFFPIALAVVFAIAIVTLLMNYLLWNELSEEEPEVEDDVDPVISINTLPKSHALDIVKLAACGRGHVVSVSLDRSTSIYLFDARSKTYSKVSLKTASMSPPLWPIIATAIDETGQWLALCTDTGRLAFWNFAERRFTHSVAICLRGHLPLMFSFAAIQSDDAERLDLVITTSDGWITDVELYSSRVARHQIHDSRILSSSLSGSIKDQINILSVSRGSRVWLTTGTLDGEWTSEILSGLATRPTVDTNVSKYKSADCVMHTYQIGDDLSSLICLRPSLDDESRSCQGLESATSLEHRVERPGVWGATLAQSIIGIHQRFSSRASSPASTSSDTKINVPSSPNGHANGSLKYRYASPPASPKAGRTHHTSPSTASSDTNLWEAWTLSSTGEFHAVPLLSSKARRDAEPAHPGSNPADTDADEQLFVANPGPIARLGKRSIAVGFGNTVKIVSLGNERFEEDGDAGQGRALASIKWRKKGFSRKAW
ncbi:hypothetical protein H2199_001512 [Coniosporium tulheliwenetii]|uniref:Uncharacterized protein n=1 Tax=Coniosporium tulheliwenetii TaxID=3383036 RepID=A0ACC2ZJP2_9PEZI|nr:hypothetical protein H2199_001512 [Cladosporium sp. JES 115]